ncbi:MAG: hypothetical protein JWP12_1745 [Bacteroidetes bacterium]|nr:hypothetical protein [Bacteroidota bacterium]
MKKTLLAVFISFTVFYVSCRKEMEKPFWDTEILAPLVNASLNINNILPDSILQANADSSLKIVYEGNIYNISMDTLFNIPDTTLSSSYNIPAPWNFPASTNIISNSLSETTYPLSNGVALRSVTVKRGFVRYTIKSKIQEKTHFIYKIPSATLYGVAFTVDVNVPAAVGSTPGVYNQIFDLSGYNIDLTGIAHNKVNTLYTSFTASVSDDVSPTVIINPADSLIIENEFYGLFPYYAKGYFGTNTLNVGPDHTNFTMFNRIVDGTLRLEDVNFSLNLENPIGLDARIYINNLSSINNRTGNSINLVNSIVGAPININRASESAGIVYPTYASYPLTTSNSNIKPMIENLPDQFGYALQITTNPLGNVSGSNDFIYSDQLLKAKMRMEIPLSLIATNLTLVDTFDLNIGGNGQNIHSGTITLLADNGFPFDASIQLYMLDNDNRITDSLYTNTNTIDQAPINAALRVTGKKATKLVAPVSEAKMNLLYNTKRVKLKVKFNTASQSQYIKIYSDYAIDVKLIGDVNYTIHLN